MTLLLCGNDRIFKRGNDKFPNTSNEISHSELTKTVIFHIFEAMGENKCKILYENSETGGSITTNYGYTPAEEAENCDAAKVFARMGKKVVLLMISDTKGVKSPDAQIDGEFWEIKTNFTATASAIDNAVKKAGKQADNLIINVKSKISDAKIKFVVRERFWRTDLKRIVVIRNEKIVLEEKR